MSQVHAPTWTSHMCHARVTRAPANILQVKGDWKGGQVKSVRSSSGPSLFLCSWSNYLWIFLVSSWKSLLSWRCRLQARGACSPPGRWRAHRRDPVVVCGVNQKRKFSTSAFSKVKEKNHIEKLRKVELLLPSLAKLKEECGGSGDILKKNKKPLLFAINLFNLLCLMLYMR